MKRYNYVQIWLVLTYIFSSWFIFIFASVQGIDVQNHWIFIFISWGVVIPAFLLSVGWILLPFLAIVMFVEQGDELLRTESNGTENNGM
jgi:hypothetical protein